MLRLLVVHDPDNRPAARADVPGERGGRLGQRSYGADERGEPSAPDALGEVGQAGAVGFDDEEDGGTSPGGTDAGAVRPGRQFSGNAEPDARA